MGKKDPRIDAYISKAQDFAKPILEHLRNLVHETCPEVEETMKWSFPHFNYKGDIMCSMAAFKQHASFGFWKAALIKEAVLAKAAKSEAAMGSLGKITSLKDLPSDKKLISLIKKAAKLNEAGIKVSKKKKIKKELEIPDYFIKALSKNKKALTSFKNFSYSHKKEYVEWISEARTEETRNKRIATAIEWLSEGKPRNWKYIK
ncbi:YdeI family protein [Melioribacteraceae bacterium 4301-Me]|uniref:YdeI/OmpD-associated family protein n=1 Tax=Pyranulibacter aquaticus TaxID=3163344 RepID=UPI003595C994